MSKSFNMLILSCGTRNKIIQYFKKELGERGKVIATDCNKLAPALYDADKFYIVPKMNEKGYIDVILKICKDNNVKGILSLIDPELILLSRYKERFLEIGTIPIISDFETVEICFDKYNFNEFLKENSFNNIRSYINKEIFYEDVKNKLINYPVFVKPIRGSASTNVNKVSAKEDIEVLFSKYDDLMIQEFIDGVEYGVDVYIDMLSNKTVSIFVKEKIKMRAGETDKSRSIKDQKLFNIVQNFVMKSGFKGIIDIDIFKMNGEYYISEVNPRFGGGYPHAYECGVNMPKLIINNLLGEVNTVSIGEYQEDVYMMKYNEVKIVKN